MIDRRTFLQQLAVLGGTVVARPVHMFGSSKPEKNLYQNLEIFSEEFPRSFFFRSSESLAASGDYSYEEWEKIFSRLSGIEGKVLDEEVPGLSVNNVEYFTRFKKDHPEQFVLLHYNGNARDPRTAQHYFAGHWIYYEGCKSLADIPASSGNLTISVENANLFKVNIGRYGYSNEDLGICEIDANGKPNWHYSEQVKLVDVDTNNNTITVTRGCYGTKPMAFKSGNTWIAAHVYEGPFGPEERNPHILWYYNHSTECPRDADGKQCNDVFAEEIASLFNKGGILELFDGIEFDVLMSNVGDAYPLGDRGADTNCDGLGDNGIISGINKYSIGVIEFCRTLRNLFPEGKLILADSFKKGHQRAFGILNGVESEGWPTLGDPYFNDWTGGVNRILFWKQNGYKPSFSYINHKWGKRVQDDVKFNNHRVVLAAAQCLDIVFSNSNSPKPEPGEINGIWDELIKGREGKKYWLGKPLSNTRRLAKNTHDLLNGAGINIGPPLKNLIDPFECTSVAVEDGNLKIFSKSDNDKVKFTVKNVLTNSPDLFVTFKIKGKPLRNYPEEIGRELSSCIQEEGKSAANPGFVSWFNQEWYQVGIYFRDISSGSVDVIFELEGNEPAWISDFSIHSYPDVMAREFENGVVLINPSLHQHSFDLASMFPDVRFRRLTASSQQDVSFNNGQPESGTLALNERDAIFLIKEK